MKKILRFLSNKIFLVALAVILEIALVFYFAWNLTLNYAIVHAVLSIISFLLLIYVVNRHDNAYYRLAWAVIILSIPPFGAVLYLLIGGRQVPKELRERLSQVYPKEDYLPDYQFTAEDKKNEPWYRLVRYIYDASDFPIYQNTNSQYLESGEKKFAMMKKILREAESFIFLEYFIIKEGQMWDEIFALLKEKAAQGLDVRVIYDDWGCALFPKLKKQLEDAGIKVVVFNPLVPRLAIEMNNRDHRKLLVVDGRFGIVGGINIGDEYINEEKRFGHWKDTAVLIEGEAVHSLSLMFLQFYSYYTGLEENPDDFRYDFKEEIVNDAYVMPFADAPTDEFDVGADAHLTMINNAKHYVYIQTPYLIVGYEMIKALQLAAQSGVDVRIIVPHIPDKKIVNQVTKASYDELIKAGVKVYEYEPGFVHSKTMVADDQVAIVGTTNMDFRSYYLHFEASILFVGGPVIQDAYDDVIQTLDQSLEITQADLDAVPYLLRLFRSFLKIFSGLM